MNDDKSIFPGIVPLPNDMRAPKLVSETVINRLWDGDLEVAKAAAAQMDRILAKALPVAELLFSVPHKRRNMGYERVPVGHQDGYRCFDADKHSNAQEAFESGEYGDGMSENEAYVAWLRNDCPAPCDCSDPFCEDHDRRTQKEAETERAIDDQLHDERFGDGN
jgi:hypothetical protein